MADIKYLDWAGLQKYNSLLKAWHNADKTAMETEISDLVTLIGAAKKANASDKDLMARLSALETLVGAAEDAADSTVIDRVAEVLDWFKNLPEEEAGGVALVAQVNANKTAIGTAKDGETAGTGLTGRVEALEAVNAAADFTVTDEAVAGQYVSQVSQGSNGKISVVRADLPTMTTVADKATGHVTVSTNAETKVVTINEDDIASAKLVGELPTGDDAPVATTVVGYAKELADAVRGNAAEGDTNTMTVAAVSSRVKDLEAVAPTKVEASTTNGNIKIDGTETTVYTHPAFTAADAAAVKVGRDTQGHVVVGEILVAGDITATAAEATETAIAVSGTTVADQITSLATSIKSLDTKVAGSHEAITVTEINGLFELDADGNPKA